MADPTYKSAGGETRFFQKTGFLGYQTVKQIMTKSQDLEIVLTLAEINKILDALGNMPYRDVFQLVNKIQAQAETQLQPTNSQPSNSEIPQIITEDKTP